MLLKGSTHSCKLAPRDPSPFIPPSTVSHDCPDTVFEESCTANCSSGKAAISGTKASTVVTCGSDGAWVSDSTPPYLTREALTCSIGDLLFDGSLSGPDCASWTIGKSCAVTYVEGCQAAKETSGIWTCAYEIVAGEMVLEVEAPKCLSVVCSLDDPSTGVGHTMAMTSRLKTVVRPLAQRVMKLVGEAACSRWKRGRVWRPSRK